MKNIFYVLAMFAFAGNVYATEDVVKDESLQCEVGFHVESVLVAEAIPAVEEVTETIHHDDVTQEVTEMVCTDVGYLSGMYKDSECTKKSFLGSKYAFQEVTKTVVVEEAYDEVVVVTPAQDEIPAVYEDQCVADAVVTPVKRGGGGKCLNCDKKEVEEVDEPEEVEVFEEVEDTTVPDSSTPACQKLRTYIKYGDMNDVSDVSLLQNFFALPVTGIYDFTTLKAVHEFQNAYASEVLSPWANLLGTGYGHSTGWVYRTTQWKINSMLCPAENIPFPTLVGY